MLPSISSIIIVGKAERLRYCLYLHGPNTDKMGTGATDFARPVLQIKRSVNGP